MNTAHEIKILLLDKQLALLFVVPSRLNDMTQQLLVHSVVDRQDCCLVFQAFAHLRVPAVLVHGHAGSNARSLTP